MNILAIVAGTNEPSNSHALASAFCEGCRSKIPDAEIDILRIKDLNIRHFDLDCYKDECIEESDFKRLRTMVEKSHGVLISSPIWNFSVPAHLKNLVDRMGSFALDKSRSKGTLNGKPFFLIFTGGTPLAVWKVLMKKTLSSIPQSIKYFGGTIISSHFEPECVLGRGRFGLIVDKRLESLNHMKEEGMRFASIVKYYAESGKLPAKNTVINKAYSMAKKIFGRSAFTAGLKDN